MSAKMKAKGNYIAFHTHFLSKNVLKSDFLYFCEMFSNNLNLCLQSHTV